MFSDLVVENKPTEKNEEMQPKKEWEKSNMVSEMLKKNSALSKR